MNTPDKEGIEPLESVLLKVLDDIANWNNDDEDNTSKNFINPVLQALGWNMSDRTHIHTKFPVNDNNEKVDYCLKCDDTPVAFLEAKAGDLDKARTESKGRKRTPEQQLFEYQADFAVTLLVLTNGINWRFYLPRGPKAEWQFLTLTLRQEMTEFKHHTRDYFAKWASKQLHTVLARTAVCDRSAIDAAKQLKREERLLNTVIDELEEPLRVLIAEARNKIGVASAGIVSDERILEMLLTRVDSTDMDVEGDEDVDDETLVEASRRAMNTSIVQFAFKGEVVKVSSSAEAIQRLWECWLTEMGEVEFARIGSRFQSIFAETSHPVSPFRHNAAQLRDENGQLTRYWVATDRNTLGSVRVMERVHEAFGGARAALNIKVVDQDGSTLELQ